MKPVWRIVRNVVLGFLALIVIAFIWASVQPPSNPIWGVTFSAPEARYLGLDANQAFLAVLNDLNVKHIRLGLYWNEIETAPGVYNWSEVDQEVQEATAANAQLTLVVGARVPRWPECHIPTWADPNNTLDTQALLTYVTAAVNRYKDSPAVVRWQVENEPGFTLFGDCPPMSSALLGQETALVRSLDTRPIQITVSGEIQPWFPVEGYADVLGTSLYRTTWNRFFGYVTYPLPPGFYRLRALGARLFVKQVIISELQGEPWFQDPSNIGNIADDANLFTPAQLQANATFATQTGMSEVYFWGVEWWYALKQAGHPELWNAAKTIMGGGS